MLSFVLLTTPSMATDISQKDAGVYEVFSQKPNKVRYKLVMKDGEPALEDEGGSGLLSKIHCLSDCEFRKSNKEEIERFFSQKIDHENLITACIHNPVVAFCRRSPKTNPNSQLYFLFAIFTPNPAFFPIVRAD